MERKKSRICIFEGCTSHSSFGFPGQRAQWCSKHQEHGSLNVRSKRCEFQGCPKYPHYGFPGQTPRWCVSHRAEGAEDIKSRKCVVEGCSKHPTYGLPGTRIRKWCRAHRIDGSENVIGKSCVIKGCVKQPSYGLPGQKAKWCSRHREKGSQHKTNEHCHFEGCPSLPSFGFLGQNAKWCSKHRVEGTDNIKSKKCEFQDCRTTAHYGLPGTRVKKWCFKHQPEEARDLTNRKCVNQDCLKQGTYSIPGLPGKLFCASHHPEGTFKLKARCHHSGCDETPCYSSSKENIPNSCYLHKIEGQKDFHRFPCSNCQLVYTPDNLFYVNDTIYCEYCLIHLFDLDEIKNRKEFNLQAGLFLYSQLGESFSLKNKTRIEHIYCRALQGFFSQLTHQEIIDSSFDQTIDYACSQKRPDIHYTFIQRNGSLFSLLIEIDENQHKHYFRRCEQARMLEIDSTLKCGYLQEVGKEPEEQKGLLQRHHTLFLRVNPDYFTSDRVLDRTPLEKRLQTLYSAISILLSKDFTLNLGVGYLFYDGWDGILTINDLKWEDGEICSIPSFIVE